jgi:FimV-like protein
MKAQRMLCRLLLACAMVSGAGAALAQAQAAGSSYQVVRGDTLFGIARGKAKLEGVTRNQMILAIWRANQSAFPGGNVNLLGVGTILVIPTREAAAGIDSAAADQEVRELLAKSAALGTSVASAKPPGPTAVPAPAVGALGKEEAAKRYREGLVLERKGDHAGAFKAFLEAGEAGNGLAQRRLGEIYDTGSPAVKHDYQASLKWYQKAREQGIEIPKPIQRGPVH